MAPRKVASAKALKGLLDENLITDLEFKREKEKCFSVNDLTEQYALTLEKVVAGLRDSKNLLDLEVLNVEVEYVRSKRAFLGSTVVIIVHAGNPSAQPATSMPENNAPTDSSTAAYSSSDDDYAPSLDDSDSNSDADSDSDSESDREDSDSADEELAEQLVRACSSGLLSGRFEWDIYTM
ncbi:hypothetical protein CYMTET_31653 [Cymbomonas tetramitiformis]|uniref:Uncharacterized protein n=1 Tax=Cymbomonas tetramitiformis TaxID=36881 RepID=A0AAE0FGK1_9CHLO|nr:hypothetical protein CYMTET_31653 [Cymbomonas tetramitiformis]